MRPSLCVLITLSLCFAASSQRARAAPQPETETAQPPQRAEATSGEENLERILELIENMSRELAELRKEVAALRELHQAGASVSPVSPTAADPPSGQEAATTPPTAEEVPQPTLDLLWRTTTSAERAERAARAERARRFSLLDLNVGGGENDDLTFTVKGRYFSRFGDRRALQAEGTYQYLRRRQEGQLDLGLINRVGGFQLGLFASLKYVSFREFQKGGSVSQAAATADWLFGRGRLGLYGTASVRDKAVLDRQLVRRSFVDETFLDVVDQVGFSGQLGLSGDAYLEGNVGYLIASNSRRRTGGALRFVRPLNPGWAFTAEWSWNDTELPQSGDNERFIVGLQTGTWILPQHFAGLSEPVPVEIPEIRYEVRSREVQIGNDPPIADAGPDQVLLVDCPSQPCPVTVELDGSGSRDPEGDPLSYSWTGRLGFDEGEILEPSDRSMTSFMAREGKQYVIRLTVSDGTSSGFDETTVRVQPRRPVVIARFKARPQSTKPGSTVRIEWKVHQATRVTLSGEHGFGRRSVEIDRGFLDVTPTQTTSYTLTAENGFSSDQRSVTVTVGSP